MTLRQYYGLTHSRSHGTPQHEFQPLLYERGEGGFALYRLLTGTFQKSFVQANGGSHASEHTQSMSICQWPAPGATARGLALARVRGRGGCQPGGRDLTIPQA